MKPVAIIIHTSPYWDAYNEDGRFITEHYSFAQCCSNVERYGYKIASHNSRVGRTILDKIEARGIKVKETIKPRQL